jgi:hypothetical protein
MIPNWTPLAGAWGRITTRKEEAMELDSTIFLKPEDKELFRRHYTPDQLVMVNSLLKRMGRVSDLRDLSGMIQTAACTFMEEIEALGGEGDRYADIEDKAGTLFGSLAELFCSLTDCLERHVSQVRATQEWEDENGQ